MSNGRERSEAHNVSIFPGNLELLNNGTKITLRVPRALTVHIPRSVFLECLARVQPTMFSHFFHFHLLHQTLRPH